MLLHHETVCNGSTGEVRRLEGCGGGGGGGLYVGQRGRSSPSNDDNTFKKIILQLFMSDRHQTPQYVVKDPGAVPVQHLAVVFFAGG